jgi:hypothetical protein
MKKTATYLICILLFLCLVYGFFLENKTENIEIKVFGTFSLFLICIRALIFLKDE